jgi:hypothetical protein
MSSAAYKLASLLARRQIITATFADMVRTLPLPICFIAFVYIVISL